MNRLRDRVLAASLGALALAGVARGGDVVIAEVYPFGGGTGTYTFDYVVLKNRSPQPVSLAGWSLQVTGPSGGAWNKKNLLNVTLQPGQTWLVVGAGTGANATPTPDQFDSIINLNPAGGRVALVRNTSFMTALCPHFAPIVEDFVGYGSSNCFRGAPPLVNPLPTNMAYARVGSGCVDTQENGLDFVVANPNPWPSIYPYQSCGSQFSVLTASVVGVGRVQSVPGGLDCPSTCQLSVPVASEVQVFAAPEPGYRLREWQGPGAGFAPRVVTLNTDLALTAVFDCFADLCGIGGPPELPDQQVTVDDLILFVNAFSEGCPDARVPCNPSDLTGVGGPPEAADGQLTVDDLIAFVNGFADGCQNP